MVEETHYERVVRFMREQPAGATVAFHEDAISIVCPMKFNYADAAPGDLYTWLTILPPEEPAEDPMDMNRPYDATLEITFDGDVRAIRIVPDAGPAIEVDAPDFLTSVREMWDWWLHHVEQVDEHVWRRRVWTLAAIEAALADWSTRHAGRDDLRFAFDPSPSASLERPDRRG
jgi:hypothetical protein